MLWLLLLAPRHHQGERVLRLCRHLHLPLVSPAAGAGEGEGVARVVEQQQPGGRVPARGHRGPHLAPPASVQARGLGRRAVPPRVQLSAIVRECFHNIRRGPTIYFSLMKVPTGVFTPRIKTIDIGISGIKMGRLAAWSSLNTAKNFAKFRCQLFPRGLHPPSVYTGGAPAPAPGDDGELRRHEVQHSGQRHHHPRPAHLHLQQHRHAVLCSERRMLDIYSNISFPVLILIWKELTRC